MAHDELHENGRPTKGVRRTTRGFCVRFSEDERARLAAAVAERQHEQSAAELIREACAAFGLI